MFPMPVRKRKNGKMHVYCHKRRVWRLPGRQLLLKDRRADRPWIPPRCPWRVSPRAPHCRLLSVPVKAQHRVSPKSP